MARVHSIRERGQAAVELAMILPFMVMLLGSVFVCGQAFVESQLIAGAASEGARKASFLGWEDDGVARAIIEDTVEDAVALSGTSFKPDEMEVNVVWPTTPSGRVRVEVSYPMTLDFGVFSFDETVTRTRTMRVIQ